MNNAQVAKLLDAPLLLVTKGGIGSSFDELMLNISLCEKYNLKIAGIILNKVIPEKKDEISRYFQKALKRLEIPFLGALPFDMLLAQPTFRDLAQYLDLEILQGQDMCLKHVQNMSIIASNNQLPELKPYDLVIVSSSREGLISAILQQTNSSKIPIGLILTGDPLPSEWMLNELQRSDHFVLSTTRNSQDVLITLSNFFAKIQSQDTAKIHEAIALVQKYVDLKHLVRNCIS